MSECKCIEQLKKDITRKLAEEKGIDKETIFTETNSCLILDESTVKEMYYMPITAKWYTETKTGKSKKNKEDFNITFTYCPFCGKKRE